MCGQFLVRNESGVKVRKVKRQIYRCIESDCCSRWQLYRTVETLGLIYTHYVPDVFELEMNVCLSSVGKKIIYKNAML
jgi:hypothetical protein